MEEKNTIGHEEAFSTLKAIVEKADVAMLVSIDSNGKIVSRPMQLQKMNYEGDIWFLTRTDTDKYEDIKANNNVNVIITDKSYASISGIAEFVNEPEKIKQFWSKAYELIFDLQADDPRLTLIKVTSTSAEYWTTGSLVKSAYNFVKKVVSNEASITPGKSTNETLEL